MITIAITWIAYKAHREASGYMKVESVTFNGYVTLIADVLIVALICWAVK